MKLIISFLLILAIADCKLSKLIRMEHLDVPVQNSEISKLTRSRNRIVNGLDVLPEDQHKFSFMVRLSMLYYNGRYYACGGAVISKEWVLSAAHCMDNAKEIEMFFGTLNENEEEKFKRVAYAPNDIIYHPDFTRSTYMHDIGLIKLTPTIEYSGEVYPIRLPYRDEPCDNYFGRMVTICGWGMHQDYYDDDTNLKYQNVSIVHNEEECSGTWGNYFKKDAMICVDASGSRGACQGDSGSPMVYTQSNGLQLAIGITSFGTSAGCENSAHRVYTCVNGNSNRDFIYEHTKDDYLNT